MSDDLSSEALMSLKSGTFREFQLYIGYKFDTWRNSAAGTTNEPSPSHIPSGNRDI
jgi:hypothetical protein